MTPSRPVRAPAATVRAAVCLLGQIQATVRALLLASLLALPTALPGLAQQSGWIKSHGITTFPGDSLKYPADFPHLDYVKPDAPKAGEMSIWAFGGYDSMNPYSIKGRAERLASSPYESLLTETADEIGSSYGLLAESIEYPEDRSQVIFNLRPGVKFSDGSAMTADDVFFSYELFRDKGLPSFRKVLGEQVETAEVLGPHRIRFTFRPEVPKRDVIQAVGGLPIFSKAHYLANDLDLQETSMMPFLGTGPYVPFDFDVGQTAVYKRNPDYWGKALPIMIGRSNFDFLRLEYFGDYSVAMEGFKGGTYFFRNEASSRDWATSYNFPAVTDGYVIREELDDGTIAFGQSFAMNLRREQFQDVRVREAIGLLFNFEWSNEQLFYGLYTRINSFWENSDLAATGLPSAEELALLEPLADHLPRGVLEQDAAIAPVSGDRQLDRGNLRKANDLLNAAGWIVGTDGRRRKDGQTLKVEFLNDSQTFDRIVNPYVQNLQRAGIDAVHIRVDNAESTNRERSHDFDIANAQFPMGYIPGAGLKQYFGSQSVDDVFNTMGLQSVAVDSLIETVIAAKSRAELQTAVHALDRVLRAYRFWVPQWYKNKHTVAYYDMYEHPDPLPPYALGNLDFWWYNAEKAARLQAAGIIR